MSARDAGEIVGAIILVVIIFQFLIRPVITRNKLEKKHNAMIYEMVNGMSQYYIRLNSAVSMLKETFDRFGNDIIFASELKNIAKNIWEPKTSLFSYKGADMSADEYWEYRDSITEKPISKYGINYNRELCFDFGDYLADAERARNVNPFAYEELLRYKKANDRLNEYLEKGTRLADGRIVAPRDLFSPKGFAYLMDTQNKIERQIPVMKNAVEQFNIYAKKHFYMARIAENIDHRKINLDFYPD